jgi:hypothetical protein
MKYYILKQHASGYGKYFKHEHPYKENYVAFGLTVKCFATRYPNDWMLIKFKYGK